mmetsp:Transcript_10826/g.10330  ORF Transcript_10826/g.10330 Transcript_10826/m.10330 type:complete len:334 (-) Transcript_10826:138-1139(-)
MEHNMQNKVVLRPSNNDVLCGRGSRSYCHPGNIQFRTVVANHKRRYNMSDNKFKPFIAEGIVTLLNRRNPPGRYLSQDKERRIWYEIPHNAAVQKTQQALREKTKWAKNDSQIVENNKLSSIQVSKSNRKMVSKKIATAARIEMRHTDKENELGAPQPLTPIVSNQTLRLNETPPLNGTVSTPRRVSIEEKHNEIEDNRDLSSGHCSPVESSTLFDVKTNILKKEIYLLDAFKNRLIADAQSLMASRAAKSRMERENFENISPTIGTELRPPLYMNHIVPDYSSQHRMMPLKRSDEVVNGPVVMKTNESNQEFGCSKFMYQILLESLTAGRTT